jgi:excinuclease UvrABC nuclease subunit
MIKSRFIPVYRLEKGRRRSNISDARQRPGVYIIKELGKIVYIGHSASDVYKTAMRHFQSWDDPTQDRVTYVNKQLDNYTIRIIFTTPKQAPALEKKLILRHNPRDNELKYGSYTVNAYDREVLEIYDNTEIAPF